MSGCSLLTPKLEIEGQLLIDCPVVLPAITTTQCDVGWNESELMWYGAYNECALRHNELVRLLRDNH